MRPEAIVRNWVGQVDQKIMERYTHIADQISKRAMGDLFATDDGQEYLEGPLPADGKS